jgi:hypothetical protein
VPAYGPPVRNPRRVGAQESRQEERDSETTGNAVRVSLRRDASLRASWWPRHNQPADAQLLFRTGQGHLCLSVPGAWCVLP